MRLQTRDCIMTLCSGQRASQQVPVINVTDVDVDVTAGHAEVPCVQ